MGVWVGAGAQPACPRPRTSRTPGGQSPVAAGPRRARPGPKSARRRRRRLESAAAGAPPAGLSVSPAAGRRRRRETGPERHSDTPALARPRIEPSTPVRKAPRLQRPLAVRGARASMQARDLCWGSWGARGLFARAMGGIPSMGWMGGASPCIDGRGFDAVATSVALTVVISEHRQKGRAFESRLANRHSS